MISLDEIVTDLKIRAAAASSLCEGSAAERMRLGDTPELLNAAALLVQRAADRVNA